MVTCYGFLLQLSFNKRSLNLVGKFGLKVVLGATACFRSIMKSFISKDEGIFVPHGMTLFICHCHKMQNKAEAIAFYLKPKAQRTVTD